MRRSIAIFAGEDSFIYVDIWNDSNTEGGGGKGGNAVVVIRM